MKKMTLNVETLSVESFEAAAPETSRGTAAGEAFMTSPNVCVTRNCGDSEVRACRAEW